MYITFYFQTIKAFHELGMCLSYSGMLKVIDKSVSKFDGAILEWKADFVEALTTYSFEEGLGQAIINSHALLLCLIIYII